MKIYSLLLAALLLAGCNNNNHDYTPKPRGYFRIVFPKKEYQAYEGGCPFTFLYPKYAVIEPDSSRGAQNCWLNMRFRQFKGTLHMSYQPVRSKKEFNELTEDARTVAFKHTVKATSIDQGLIRFPGRQLYGIYYTIDGNAASSAQFFLTDSTHNYLRCALYFYTEPRLDSIAPVLDFVKKDMNVMINSFRWK
jgi:gliding motility-associated lipoprotein GldD